MCDLRTSRRCLPLYHLNQYLPSTLTDIVGAWDIQLPGRQSSILYRTGARTFHSGSLKTPCGALTSWDRLSGFDDMCVQLHNLECAFLGKGLVANVKESSN